MTKLKRMREQIKQWTVDAVVVAAGGMVGLVAGSAIVATFAQGSVPSHSRITDDTALYQSLSEIKVPKEPPLRVSDEIKKLSAMENHYKESLPLGSRAIAHPMKRIQNKKYHWNSNR